LIQVFLQTNRFRKDQPQYMPCLAVPLPRPTHDTLEVSRWADVLCERMYKPDYAYKKAGIVLSEISPVTHHQADWIEPDMLSNDKLMQALDGLNQRFGRGAVTVSTQGAYKEWQMRQERKSPHYTTCWEDVPLV
jgi:DNA polymerase V